MAASMSSADLREVRVLAQKLWGQCRDSPSLYKTLANDIRKLRNALEDVEDAFADDEKPRTAPEVKVLERVWTCRVVLTELDWTLQSFRCSTHKWQDVRPEAIRRLKEKVGEASGELGVAFDALVMAGEAGDEGEGGGAKVDIVVTEPDNGVATSAGAEHAPAGDLSTTSSSQSFHSAPSPTTPSPTTQTPPTPTNIPLPTSPPPLKRTTSDEKEVYDMSRAYTFDTVLTARERSSPMLDSAVDWYKPFAEMDPLSIDIGQASALLMGRVWKPGEEEGTDEEGEIIGRKRKHSGVGVEGLGITMREGAESVGVDVKEGGEGKVDGASEATPPKTPVAATSGDWSDGTTAAGPRDPPEEDTLIAPPTAQSPPLNLTKAISTTTQHPTERINEATEGVMVSHPVVSHQAAKSQNPAIDNMASGEGSKRESQNETPSSAYQVPSFDFESPRDLSNGDDSPVAKLLADMAHRRSGEETREHPNEASRTKVDMPQWPVDIDSAPASSEETISSSMADSKVEVYEPGAKQGSQRELSLDGGTLETMVTKTAISSDDPSGSETQTDESNTVSEDTEAPSVLAVETSPNPPPPSRKPPPPPQGQQERITRRPIPKPRAKYRIVNPSPPTRSNTDASEDLYSSSRPTSPRLASRSPSPNNLNQPQAGPQAVPQVRIDPSALDNKLHSRLSQASKRASKSHADLQPRASHHRRATMGVPHIASLLKPEARSDPGLEVIDGRDSNGEVQTRPGIAPRRSVDETLDVRHSFLSPGNNDGGSFQRSRSVSAPERQRSLSTSDLHAAAKPARPAPRQVESAMQQPLQSEHDVREYYGAPSISNFGSNGVDVGEERMSRICACWNAQRWDEAEAYLMGQLETLMEHHDLASVRRVRHLLGVCLSFKGDWDRALPWFVSVLRTPVTDPSELDAGDCAAAYWLGDTYALLNRRTEALLAYCMAEQSETIRGAALSGLQTCLDADQQAVQLGVSKADFKVRWAQEALANREAPADTILSPGIITPHAAKVCLELKPRHFRPAPMSLSPEKSRAALLFSLNRSSSDFRHYQRLTLHPGAFVPHTAWPMPYDPLFVMANVSRGRLIAYECDLLDVFATNPEARVPKSGPLGAARLSTFTCHDLPWLIRTLRRCLETLDMKWSEVANVEGVWFLVRQTLMQENIATMHFFSIALFRQSLRSGYGVEVCPDGVGSARLIRLSLGHVNGVPVAQEKQTRRFIRDFLETEYRACAKTEKGTVLPKRRSLLKTKPAVAELEAAPGSAPLPPKDLKAEGGGLGAVREYASPGVGGADAGVRVNRAGMTGWAPPIPPRPIPDASRPSLGGFGKAMTGSGTRSEERILERASLNQGKARMWLGLGGK